MKVLTTLKTDLIKIEVWVKSVFAIAIGGGLSAAADIYHQGKAFELNAAHFLELKAKFISGAGVALIMYWARSPLGQKGKDEVPPSNAPTTPPTPGA